MAFAYIFRDDYSICWFLQKLPSNAGYSCLIHVRQWKYFLPSYHLSLNFINVISCWTAIFTLTKLNSVFFFMIYASDFFRKSFITTKGQVIGLFVFPFLHLQLFFPISYCLKKTSSLCYIVAMIVIFFLFPVRKELHLQFFHKIVLLWVFN